MFSHLLLANQKWKINEYFKFDVIEDAPAPPVKAVLGPVPTDFALKSDYYTDCQQVRIEFKMCKGFEVFFTMLKTEY